MSVVIIGAGPTGLGVAHTLHGEHVIFDKAHHVGGLCRSLSINGSVFDIGGHSFHTPFPEIWKIWSEQSGVELFRQKRSAWVEHKGDLIPYPFQKNYTKLSDRGTVQRIQDTIGDAGNASESGNYYEWIVRQFGEGIAHEFMLPYNEKLWADDLRSISTEWVHERVPIGDTAKQEFRTDGGQRTPLQADTRVHYPSEGGFGRIFEGLVPDRSRLRLGDEIVAVNGKARTVVSGLGEVVPYQQLISTMPIVELVNLIREHKPASVVDAAANLRAMSLYVILLGGPRTETNNMQRIYSSEPTWSFHKLALNHNSSDALRCSGRMSVMAEVSVSESKQVDPDAALHNTVQYLVSRRLLADASKLDVAAWKHVKYAYPIYTHNRVRAVREIKQWLSGFGIRSAGRFGSWEYKNSDASYFEGMTLGRTLNASMNLGGR